MDACVTVEPGFGGQSFMADMLPKIAALRAEIDRRKQDTAIQVDGGINGETAGLTAGRGHGGRGGQRAVQGCRSGGAGALHSGLLTGLGGAVQPQEGISHGNGAAVFRGIGRGGVPLPGAAGEFPHQVLDAPEAALPRGKGQAGIFPRTNIRSCPPRAAAAFPAADGSGAAPPPDGTTAPHPPPRICTAPRPFLAGCGDGFQWG